MPVVVHRHFKARLKLVSVAGEKLLPKLPNLNLYLTFMPFLVIWLMTA